MQILSPRDYTSFQTLAKMNQDELHRTVYRILKKTYGKDNVKNDKDWVYAIGNIPIALVAHLDTVFASPPTEIFYDRIQNVIWSPQGLGADDRAGVYSILQIISKGYRPHVIFTTNEEWGGVGARALSYQECPFKDLRYIIELDRAHYQDCVFYECDNDKFQTYIESFGFTTERGTYSDICELCPMWDIAGVNLSIGYRDEHSFSEVLFIAPMMRTINKVIQMLENPPAERFIFEWDCGQYAAACYKCGKKGVAFLMTPVEDDKGCKHWYCDDCVTNENVEWCNECYEGFVPGVLVNGICPHCRDVKKRLKSYGITYPISGYQDEI